ncbi:hypothetical protein H312_00927 [Anncaliia algerae PRA339]|uniref:Small GTP-binding protein domain n=1 Tax=Anncaliia algerae PRA339 TaxID=1288291 RepID=A0A059F2X7_9MICR|nr:hypothetical protein H312_00927 [Anncaliia algerae PRA339]
MSRICKRFWKRIVNAYKQIFVRRLKVVLLGTECSGKSRLIKRIFEDSYDEEQEQRKHSNRILKYNLNGIEFTIYDVPGGKENIPKWDFFYKKADAVIFTFDSTSDEKNSMEAENQLSALLYRNMWTKRNLLVLGTKNDMQQAKSCRDIILSLNLMDIVDREVSCYSVSAKTKVNLELVIRWLEEQTELQSNK